MFVLLCSIFVLFSLLGGISFCNTQYVILDSHQYEQKILTCVAPHLTEINIQSFSKRWFANHLINIISQYFLQLRIFLVLLQHLVFLYFRKTLKNKQLRGPTNKIQKGIDLYETFWPQDFWVKGVYPYTPLLTQFWTQMRQQFWFRIPFSLFLTSEKPNISLYF